MPGFIAQDGTRQEVALAVDIYARAVDRGISVPQLINLEYPTAPGMQSTTFEQLCADCGLVVKANDEFGLKSPTLKSILSGQSQINAAAVADANPASRILFPAVIIGLVESQLAEDMTSDPAAFDKMIALETSVTSNRVEQPVVNMTNAEAARARAISQLAPPQRMLTITASDSSRALPTFSLGLEVSDQALAATTLNFVSMSVNRWRQKERALRVVEYLLGCLNGDADNDQSALAQTNADSYDSSIVVAGNLSKKAIVKWMVHNFYQRRLSHVVCDEDCLLAFEAALTSSHTGAYVPGALIPRMSVINRMLDTLNFFALPSSSGWPANTMMGLDKRFAMHRIYNIAAQYSAVEQFVMRRANALRFDFSEIVYRLFDDAFDVLSLSLSET